MRLLQVRGEINKPRLLAQTYQPSELSRFSLSKARYEFQLVSK